jgi:hypothetical protein
MAYEERGFMELVCNITRIQTIRGSNQHKYQTSADKQRHGLKNRGLPIFEKTYKQEYKYWNSEYNTMGNIHWLEMMHVSTIVRMYYTQVKNR